MNAAHLIIAVLATLCFVVAAGFNDNRYGWIGAAIAMLLVLVP